MQEFDADDDVITGINVTPLVDIILVLLIIFMVTSRFISEPSVGVSLPKSSSGGPTESSDRNVFLSLDADRGLYLNSVPVERSEIGARMKALLAEKPDMNLVLRADKSLSHGEVMAVLDLVREAGVTQFGIAVEGKMQ